MSNVQDSPKLTKSFSFYKGIGQKLFEYFQNFFNLIMKYCISSTYVELYNGWVGEKVTDLFTHIYLSILSL